MNVPGLKILSRKSYELAAISVFDNPLASRFDENDAVLYFATTSRCRGSGCSSDGSIEMCQKQFHATPAHVYQNYQAMIRLAVKLRFLVGIGRRTAEINGTLGFPQVREMLGQLAAEASMIDRAGGGDGGQGRPARRLFRARPATPLYTAPGC